LLVMMSAGADEMDAGFEELAKLSPAERFEQWTSKDSRRYELLVLAVESCYMLLYIAYQIFLRNTVALEASHAFPKPLTPILICAVRSWRLFGYSPHCLQRRRSCRWVLGTAFHSFVLTWSGFMAGLYIAKNLRPDFSSRWVSGMYVGPTHFVFLLTVLCLTVLDRVQTLVASVLAFAFFALPITYAIIDFFSEDRELTYDVVEMFIEQLTLLVAVVMLCVVRWVSWSDRVAHFRREERLKTGIIDEKLKRCHVEFAVQQLNDSMVPQEDQTSYLSGHGFADCAQTAAAMARKSPPSAFSAPPNMDSLALLQSTSPRCDCLPMSTTVQVDGGGKPVSQLKIGDRVVCYDHLAGCIKLVEVEDCEVVSGPCSWSQVTLADGTRISVTADHPVRAVGEDGEGAGRGVAGLGGGRVIRAGELKPGKDMLKILRLGAVTVKAVHTEPDEQPRVRVNLRQSWRFSLFCSQGSGPESTSVAVESSSGLDGRHEQLLQVQNTFLNFPEEASQTGAVPGRRAWSDPGAAAPAAPPPPEAAVPSEHGFEARGEDSSDAAGNGCDEPPSGSTSSTEGNPDAQHAKGCCQPCLFQTRYYADPERYPACTKPECFARYCHLSHSESYLATYRSMKRRYEKKNRVARRKGLFTEGAGAGAVGAAEAVPMPSPQCEL